MNATGLSILLGLDAFRRQKGVLRYSSGPISMPGSDFQLKNRPNSRPIITTWATLATASEQAVLRQSQTGAGVVFIDESANCNQTFRTREGEPWLVNVNF